MNKMGLFAIGMAGGDAGEPKNPNYTGPYSESLCGSNRDSVLPRTAAGTIAANKSVGEAPLESGLAFRGSMGDELRTEGIRGDPGAPRFTMWGENQLPEYRES